MLTYTLFIVGFYFLIKGADWLIEGASSVAKKFKVSNLMIGLTVVSFGTSAPELIANILLILGISAIIFPLAVRKGTVNKEIPLNLLAVFVLWLFANDQLNDNVAFSTLSRIDGAIFLAFFVIFMYYTLGLSKVEGESEEV